MKKVILLSGIALTMTVISVGCGNEKSNMGNQEVVAIQPATNIEDTEQVVDQVVQEPQVEDSLVEDVQNNTTNDTNTNTSVNNQENYITELEAKEIALTHAGVKEADTKYLTVKFEYDNGVAEYEIEWDVERVEYEYEINATTGDIIGFSKDLE